jgi:hypothetical protein
VRTARSNNGERWLIGSVRLRQATTNKPQRCVALASNDDYIFYIASRGRAKTTKMKIFDHNKNIACKKDFFAMIGLSKQQRTTPPI